MTEIPAWSASRGSERDRCRENGRLVLRTFFCEMGHFEMSAGTWRPSLA